MFPGLIDAHVHFGFGEKITEYTSETVYAAQGGIAAALSDDDEVLLHEQDTMVAGDGLCDPAAVRGERPGDCRRDGALPDTALACGHSHNMCHVWDPKRTPPPSDVGHAVLASARRFFG